MKKNGIALILAGCFLLLSACGIKVGERFDGEVNNFEGVTMTVVEGTVRPGGLTVQVLNTTDEEIDSGNAYDFGVQVERNGAWYWLEEEGERANTAEVLIYLKDTPRELEFNWADRYGSLPKGHYRVVKGFFESAYSNFRLAAEFTLD